MPLDSLDLSTKASPNMLKIQVTDRRAWLSVDVDPRSAIITLDDNAMEETRQIVTQVQNNPLPLYLRSPDQFDMPEWRRTMSAAREMLNCGLGFTIIDRLPMDNFDEEDMKTEIRNKDASWRFSKLNGLKLLNWMDSLPNGQANRAMKELFLYASSQTDKSSVHYKLSE